jgi:dephospho-CoA kinase
LEKAKLKVLGITGSSGSGKTTVSDILRLKGIDVIDSDKVAKEMTKPNSPYLNNIIADFGKEILLEDGNLNRKKLAQIIYDDKEALKKLNSITFNYVFKEILRRLKNFEEQGKEIIGIDAPLLFECGLNKYCSIVIAVTANDEQKIEKICERDNISREVAIKRLKIQHPDNYYVERADIEIKNDIGDYDKLYIDVCNLLKDIKNDM